MSSDKTTHDTPEMYKLIDRLLNDPEVKLLNFNVFWGHEAGDRTPEQRAAAINRVLDLAMDGTRSSEPPDNIGPQRDVSEIIAEVEARNAK